MFDCDNNGAGWNRQIHHVLWENSSFPIGKFGLCREKGTENA